MSAGKGGGTTVQTAELTPEQRAMIGAQTNFFTSTIAPAYQQAVGGARDIYNLSAPGTTYAAQNLAGVAGQAQEAFQAAQLRGIKSRFLYLPDENHWVLKPQNALVWQREFYKWLKETL